MKLTFRQIDPFVQNPDPTARVILIYGPDYGLMRERSNNIAATVVEDLNDPFNVSVLGSDTLKDDPARLIDEANAISMMGGRRLVRVVGASDKITPVLKEYLANPSMDTVVLLEADELGPKSSLRLLCERAKNAAALPCYVDDDNQAAQLIRRAFHDEGKQIDQDAVIWLAANISGNRLKIRSEIEKIITYKGDDLSPVSLTDAQKICGQAGAQSFDDLSYSMAGNNPKAAMKAYLTLMDEGVADAAILRTIQNHFRRLHLAKSIIAEGRSMDEAMKSLMPPIFFKQEPEFKRQLNRWSQKALANILSKLADLEAQTRQTGMPNETLCAQAVLSISMIK